MDSLELTKRAVLALDNKKAANIEVLRVDDVTILGDYFIIASADNTTHVRALADELEYQLKNAGAVPRRIGLYWIIATLLSIFFTSRRGTTITLKNFGQTGYVWMSMPSLRKLIKRRSR